MNTNKLLRCAFATLIIAGSFDFAIPINDNEGFGTQLHAGVNGKHAKSGWKLFKSCIGCEEKTIYKGFEKTGKMGRLKGLSNEKVRITAGMLKDPKKVMAATEMLTNNLERISASDEVLPKIGEYLSETKANESTPKIINCFREDANKVRLCLYENNTLMLNKLIKSAPKSIRLTEYDVYAMQENSYVADGIEYVSFVIPKKPQFVLGGQYNGRVFDCMIFNLPKDTQGEWQRFKEFLFAFIQDLLQRPGQLWDEYLFRRKLAELHFNSQDITEIEHYSFAQVTKKSHDDDYRFVQAQVA